LGKPKGYQGALGPGDVMGDIPWARFVNGTPPKPKFLDTLTGRVLQKRERKPQETTFPKTQSFFRKYLHGAFQTPAEPFRTLLNL